MRADGDCDDKDSTVHPGAAEVCDGVDEDCDGATDEDASDAVVCVPDEDLDDYGQDVSTQLCCALGDGWVAPGESDCDDDNRTVNPSGREVCNLLDDDCDGEIDEDDDGDGSVDSLCNLFGDHMVSDADVKILGDYAAGQRSSFLLSDNDADGYDDLWLGAENAYVDGAWKTGLVYLLPGPIGVGGNVRDMATAVIAGSAAYDGFGQRLADADDLNADGYLDLVASGFNGGDGDLYGSAFLVRGPLASGTSTLADADATFGGVGYEHRAGSGLSLSGDTNRDGYPDLVIGADGYEDETFEGGALYLYFGQPF